MLASFKLDGIIAIDKIGTVQKVRARIPYMLCTLYVRIARGTLISIYVASRCRWELHNIVGSSCPSSLSSCVACFEAMTGAEGGSKGSRAASRVGRSFS